MEEKGGEAAMQERFVSKPLQALETQSEFIKLQPDQTGSSCACKLLFKRATGARLFLCLCVLFPSWAAGLILRRP